MNKYSIEEINNLQQKIEALTEENKELKRIIQEVAVTASKIESANL